MNRCRPSFGRLFCLPIFSLELDGGHMHRHLEVHECGSTPRLHLLAGVFEYPSALSAHELQLFRYRYKYVWRNAAQFFMPPSQQRFEAQLHATKLRQRCPDGRAIPPRYRTRLYGVVVGQFEIADAKWHSKADGSNSRKGFAPSARNGYIVSPRTYAGQASILPTRCWLWLFWARLVPEVHYLNPRVRPY
jgi:hypothetical protein